MKCSNKKDIVIGPVWIEPEYRGKGYGNILIKTVLHDLEHDYERAYAFVSKSNLPSIRMFQHNLFVNIGEADIEKYTHRWILSSGGDNYIFMFENGKD